MSKVIKEVQSNKITMNGRIGHTILHPEHFNFYIENPKQTMEFARFTFPACNLIDIVKRNAGKQILVTIEFLDEKRLIV